MGRIKNNFVEVINQQILLPKIVIVVLEDDLLNAINHYKTGASLAIEPCLDWIMSELHDITVTYKQKLPTKSRKFRYPQFLWISAIHHDGFNNGNSYREKFNRCLMEVSSKYREMHVLHLVAWDPRQKGYMSNGSLTGKGLQKYWDAVNDAFQAWDKHQMRNNIPARVANANNSYFQKALLLYSARNIRTFKTTLGNSTGLPGITRINLSK